MYFIEILKITNKGTELLKTPPTENKNKLASK